MNFKEYIHKRKISPFFIHYCILIDGLLLLKHTDLVLLSLSTYSYLLTGICILSWCPNVTRKCLIKHLYRCAPLTACTFWTQNLGYDIASCPGWNGTWPGKTQDLLRNSLCTEEAFCVVSQRRCSLSLHSSLVGSGRMSIVHSPQKTVSLNFFLYFNF